MSRLLGTINNRVETQFTNESSRRLPNRLHYFSVSVFGLALPQIERDDFT